MSLTPRGKGSKEQGSSPVHQDGAAWMMICISSNTTAGTARSESSSTSMFVFCASLTMLAKSFAPEACKRQGNPKLWCSLKHKILRLSKQICIPGSNSPRWPWLCHKCIRLNFAVDDAPFRNMCGTHATMNVLGHKMYVCVCVCVCDEGIRKDCSLSETQDKTRK